jgi:transposase InsO family protein
MQIKLHKLARTTPAIRAEIRKSDLTGKELAKKFNISLETAYKWKKRESVEDRSHRRHNLNSSINAVEEEIIRELRSRIGLSLEDITEVMKRCIRPNITRSSIHRATKRLGITKSSVIVGEAVQQQRFEEVTQCGYVHMDVKYLTRLDGKRSYLYVGIDRFTRYVYAEVLYDLEPKTAGKFVERFIKHFPYKVIKIITDNGFEWTDRCSGNVKEKGTGEHPVDRVCMQNAIKHTLTRIRRPQTNGMVERFNRRVNEAIAQKIKINKNSGKNSFYSHEDRNTFLYNFIDGYNKTRLRCLNYQSPINMLNSNHTGDNTCAGMTRSADVFVLYNIQSAKLVIKKSS